MLWGNKIVTLKEFSQFNTFSADREKLLCIGAATTKCKYKTELKLSGSNKMLKLYYPHNVAARVLEYWLPTFGINDSCSAFEIISERIRLNDYYGVVSAGNASSVVREITKTCHKNTYDEASLLATAEKIKTYGAFDLEKLGYLIRVCFSVDLLSEKQTWNFLEELWEAAVLHFDNWDDYIVSFVNGQVGLGTIWYSDTLVSYVQLKKDPASLLNTYQLKN
ncbi:DUF1266 domain-containing protein [Listeria immobilis]|uniref:DUF1266 domain-containing protein n=1 Tax=Listeria immobilis TaxID=2713502 RepID=A0ABR6SSU0_9LIST|nr:DUF1266 domain-containing protein [Listeria immobilis]MBC1483210.1 DUF1266 domain-containing protein [Listeria immobilis]MBC1505936.1 DUF1266 domain-containing protein [Listeria immobilis]MBC1508580.1 DUF1266 domain-containing protein [Listeria immobilis]MBC1516620.1 DUF1266 domain-containing protein [Listeria immobilis]MBC6303742.1 DUF1266 domain-containing protein [Listeria immobilis]